MIQDFLSHGISIPIGSSNKFTKKPVKMLHQNCNHYGLVNALWHMVDHMALTNPQWLLQIDQFLTNFLVNLLLDPIGMLIP